MKIQLYTGILSAACCFCVGPWDALNGASAHATGSWINTTGGLWGTTSNWVTNPNGEFPNEAGQVALFTVPDDGSVIDSSQDITIGSLISNLGVSGTVGELIIQFSDPATTLTFDGNGNNGTIISGCVLDIFPEIILNSPLEICSSSQGIIGICGGITGIFPVTIIGNGEIDYNFTNFYTGDTTVLGGTLVLESPTPPCIVGDLIIKLSSTVVGGIDNQFSSTSNVVAINGGELNLQATSQTFATLSVGSNGVAQSDFVNTVLLSLTAPSTSFCLSLSGTSSISMFEIDFINGGGIFCDNRATDGAAGQAIIGYPSNSMVIGLNNNVNVPIKILGALDNPYDLQFQNVSFMNGTLGMTGIGAVLFSGNLGTLPADVGASPSLIVTDTFMIVGTTGTDHLGATGTIQLDGEAVLKGIGILGTAGQATVINSAFCAPGIETNLLIENSELGELTISGNYTQTSLGTFIIQADNPSVNSELIVNGGNVSLDGNLLFVANPTGNFSVGNQFVIIDSTEGGTISGQFANVFASLPPGLSPEIIYDSHQVILELVPINCPICPGIGLLPPSNLQAKLIKNRFLNETETFVHLTWFPSPSPNLRDYHVYRNDELIGKVKATLKFDEHIKIKKITEKFSVTSISSEGVESAPAVTYFTPPLN